MAVEPTTSWFAETKKYSIRRNFSPTQKSIRKCKMSEQLSDLLRLRTADKPSRFVARGNNQSIKTPLFLQEHQNYFKFKK